MAAKEKHRAKLLEYLIDPDRKDFPSRKEMALDALGFAHAVTLYEFFTPQELNAIEAEAFEIRKMSMAKDLELIMTAMKTEAKLGNVKAARFVYEYTHGPVPQETKMTVRDVTDRKFEMTKVAPQDIRKDGD